MSIPVGTLIELRLRREVFEPPVADDFKVLRSVPSRVSAEDRDIWVGQLVAVDSGESVVTAVGVHHPICDRAGAPVTCGTFTLHITVVQ